MAQGADPLTVSAIMPQSMSRAIIGRTRAVVRVRWRLWIALRGGSRPHYRLIASADFDGLGRVLGEAAHILQVQVLPQKEEPALLCSESCAPGGNKGDEA
jgi:hypothetical protein